jgi:hypothetical protein
VVDQVADHVNWKRLLTLTFHGACAGPSIQSTQGGFHSIYLLLSSASFLLSQGRFNMAPNDLVATAGCGD